MHTVCAARLAIEHLIEEDGTRSFTVEVSDDTTYIEALGLLEAAKLHIAQQYDDEDDDA